MVVVVGRVVVEVVEEMLLGERLLCERLLDERLLRSIAREGKVGVVKIRLAFSEEQEKAKDPDCKP
jgi:hypothetical protein